AGSGNRLGPAEEGWDRPDILRRLLVKGLPQDCLLGAVELGCGLLDLHIEVSVVNLGEVPATLRGEDGADDGRGIRPVRAPATGPEVAGLGRVEDDAVVLARLKRGRRDLDPSLPQRID